MGSPNKPLDREGAVLKTLSIREGDVIVIRDLKHPIPMELCYYPIWLKEPEPSNNIARITKISSITLTASATVLDFKEAILKLEIIKDLLTVDRTVPGYLRLQALNKNMHFGSVLREDGKQIKKYNLKKETALVVTVTHTLLV